MAASILITQKEWNKGDHLPLGGPLPRNDAGREMRVVQYVGKGTFDSPKIMWHYEHKLTRVRFNLVVNIMSEQCRNLGFTHAWVRSNVHTTFTERDRVTGQKTGNYSKGVQPHLTVLFANSADWVLVHGHLYVLSKSTNGMPPGLMPAQARTLYVSGKPMRVVELWEWTPTGAEEELRRRERHVEISQNQNWRFRG